MNILSRTALSTLAMMILAGCSGTRPADIGLASDRLTPCPSSPNCVSSDATDDQHRVEALGFRGPPSEAWAALHTAIRDLPRTEIVTSTDSYIHAEATSLVFRFVDDVEFHLQPDDGVIALRSASRLGSSDLGVNRNRIETIRTKFRILGMGR